MDPTTEIRKLSSMHLAGLIQILECNDSWKTLMAQIPKVLEKDKFECKISLNNRAKYHSDDFRKIENASKYRSSAEVLFDEWGTSGRIRPNIGHLLFLLQFSKLYKAADYVATALLNREPVNRPNTGPEAKVDTTLPSETIDSGEIIKCLNEIAYPSSIISNLADHEDEDVNINNHRPHNLVVPKIVVSDTAEEAKHMVLPRSRKSSGYADKHMHSEVSDMMKFSTDSSNGNVDQSTDNNITESASSEEINNSQNAEQTNDNSIADALYSDTESNIPFISALHNPKTPETNVNYSPNDLENSCVQESEVMLPALSLLLDSKSGSSAAKHAHPTVTELLQTDSTVESETVDTTEDIDSMQTSASSYSAPFKSGTTDNETDTKKGSAFMPRFDLMISNKDIAHSKNVTASNASQSQDIPNISGLQNSVRRVSFSENVSIIEDHLPNFDILLRNSASVAASIEETDDGGDALQNPTTDPFSTGCSVPIVIETDITSNAVTDFSIKSAENSDSTNNAKTLSPQLPVSRQSNASPLPTLSLNTLLPDYTYSQLEATTDNFNATAHHSEYLDRETDDDAKPNGRFLGSGAFGSVYLSIGLLDRPVAVKKLNLQNLIIVKDDDTITKQFKTEVEVLSKFKHDNLLSLVGYSCDGPTYCLIYEYISGGTLNDRLKIGKNLTWETRLKIALGTARAVSYLHTAQETPLIHRDIKTANILLDCCNKAKLCDFGLVKLSSGNNTSTATTAIGTSAYMAPEAFRGDVSVKVDTYSLGVVLLELLTGLTPFDEKRDGGFDIVTYIQFGHNKQILPLLDEKAGDWIHEGENLGLKLFSIADQCLITDKAQRPTTVDITCELTKLM